MRNALHIQGSIDIILNVSISFSCESKRPNKHTEKSSLLKPAVTASDWEVIDESGLNVCVRAVVGRGMPTCGFSIADSMS